MIDLYENCGLIYQLMKYITELLSSVFSEKMHENKRFLEIYEEKWNEIFYEVNWDSYFEKYGIAELNSEVKAAIIELFDRLAKDAEDQLDYYKGIDEYLHWLLNLDVILSYYLYNVSSKAYTFTIWKKVNEYYKFLRAKAEKNGSLFPEPFNIEPLDRFWQKQREPKPKMPKCPHCGSNSIIRWDSFRYRCKSCSKTFKRAKSHENGIKRKKER